jgi:hypothetical protein
MNKEILIKFFDDCDETQVYQYYSYLINEFGVEFVYIYCNTQKISESLKTGKYKYEIIKFLKLMDKSSWIDNLLWKFNENYPNEEEVLTISKLIEIIKT